MININYYHYVRLCASFRFCKTHPNHMRAVQMPTRLARSAAMGASSNVPNWVVIPLFILGESAVVLTINAAGKARDGTPAYNTGSLVRVSRGGVGRLTAQCPLPPVSFDTCTPVPCAT